MKLLSLKWKVALAATSMMIAVQLLVGLAQRHYLEKDLERLLSDQQFALVTRVAEELDAKFAINVDLLVRSATGLPEDALATPEAFRAHYRTRPGVFASYDEVLIVGPDGRVRADFPEVPGRVNVDASDRQFFRKVMATGKPVIAEPVLSKVRGEPIAQIAVPIRGRDGRIAAVLVGILRLSAKNFLSDLAAAKVGQTGYYFILSKGSNPVFVVHPSKELMLKPRPSGSNEAVTRALNGFEGSAVAVNTSRLEALFSFKSLKTVDWLLVAALPAAEAFAPIRQAERRLWTIILAASLLTMPLLWGVAWLLLNPITALREKMLRHAEQPHDLIPVLGARNDEIGALARSFNALMRNLRNTTRSHQESEARLQAIADNIPALVAYVDAGERFHFINQTWINWNGKQRGEVIGRTVREVIGEEAYAVIGPRMKEAMGGRTVTYERDMVESPVPRTVQATWSPDVDAEGRVVGCYVMTHDISELKRTERRQRVFSNELEQRVHERTAELEASNRELATFAYSVAHDFRTPLRAMDGYSALLQQEHAGQLDTAGQSYLRRIRSASARLATLIDDLLRLAQLTRQELRREKVDLSELAQPIIASLRAADPAREVAISVEPGMSASGDRVLLGSLLKELLGNAWKFSGRRADANIEFGSRGHEGGRAYFVRDNGVGFDMTYTDKLFTPFQRLHGIDDFPGSGVGLALASRIVERHGGSIWPEAVPGEGATFVFVLPD